LRIENNPKQGEHHEKINFTFRGFLNPAILIPDSPTGNGRSKLQANGGVLRDIKAWTKF